MDATNGKVEQTMDFLDQSLSSHQHREAISFDAYLEVLTANPPGVIRNVFQMFNDMVREYVGAGEDECPDDPESISYVNYDCTQLFVDGSYHPFFADRLFANRLISRVDAMRRGSQQNKIYVFKGPHGCGKSTFLNNLLRKFEEYANTPEGQRYETLWRIDRELVKTRSELSTLSVFEKLVEMQKETDANQFRKIQAMTDPGGDTGHLEVACPSHDLPLLMVPKDLRRSFFDELFENDEFKWKLFTDKEYEWVFKDVACTICTSLYQALLDHLGSPLKVFRSIYARPFQFNRRLGEGISVFNPGDKPLVKPVLTNEMLQNRINRIFRDSNQVNYIFSRYAKTNNGIYALMDIKSNNTERFIELHNIISEGVHKIEDIEENVNSLFFALMNPEDTRNIEDFPSFSDRIEYIKIAYVLDINTEVEIYRNIFGKHIDDSFLPRVLHNFARIIISSRMNPKSAAMLDWIKEPQSYNKFCDENLQLLKMEIYTGHIPPCLSEEDRKNLTFKRRKNIIGESETEGEKGFSGRDSIKIFNDFYSAYAKEEKLINMAALCQFFEKINVEYENPIPEGFLDSLLRMYNFTVLQQVKGALYYYNEEKISRDIQNYMFATNFEIGAVERCSYTGEKLEITEAFLEGIETKLLDPTADKTQQLAFRRGVQKEYTTTTLTQEIMVEDKPITETTLYADLYERYVFNLKEKVLDPLLKNENFRRAIKDFETDKFKAYDKKIKNDVQYLIKNLIEKFGYTQQGAREVCLYVIDQNVS